MDQVGEAAVEPLCSNNFTYRQVCSLARYYYSVNIRRGSIGRAMEKTGLTDYFGSLIMYLILFDELL